MEGINNMERIPEITTKKQIKYKMDELDSISNVISKTITEVGNLKTMLKLDLSPDCYEIPKGADFIKTCRDKLLNNHITDLAELLANVNSARRLIDPANGMLNSDFNKTMFDTPSPVKPERQGTPPISPQF